MTKKVPAIVKQIQKHKLLEIDYKTQKNISYSQLQTYTQCPHRWKLIYKDGIKVYKPSIHTVFGKAFHETVQNWLTVMYEVSGVEADKIDLPQYLHRKMLHHYLDEKKSNDGEHFSTKEELGEFLQDGILILQYIKKNRAAYFGKKGWHLVGVEIPLMIQPEDDYPGVLFKGYIDLVLYHEPTEEFYIFDIKTSTRGWSDKEKKDDIKQSQLILYKQFFHKQFGVDPEKVNIKFFIVKRKIWEESEFVQRRVQEYIPASGPIKTKKALTTMKEFITECFEPQGTIKDRVYAHNPGKDTCRFCPFSTQPRYCQYAGVEGAK